MFHTFQSIFSLDYRIGCHHIKASSYDHAKFQLKYSTQSYWNTSQPKTRHLKYYSVIYNNCGIGLTYFIWELFSGSLMYLLSCLHAIRPPLVLPASFSSSTVNGKVALSYTVHRLTHRGYAGLHGLCARWTKDSFAWPHCRPTVYVFVWCVLPMTDMQIGHWGHC